MVKLEVWVLTREYNMYDQQGEYFVKVFGSKPTPSELLAEGILESEVSWVLQGGGRQKIEDDWWHLRQETIFVPNSVLPRLNDDGWVVSPDGLTRTKVAPHAAAPMVANLGGTLRLGGYGPSKGIPK